MTRATPIPLRGDVDYLTPPRGAWWRWSADRKWIEWNDGRTLVARGELQAIVERLAPRGLPRIGAVLLLMAATRQNWDGARATALVVQSAAAVQVGDQPSAVSMVDSLVQRRLQQDVASVVDDLALIAAMPKHLREPIAAKVALAEFIFLDAYVAADASTAAGVVSLLANGFDPPGEPSKQLNAAARTDLELSALRPGLARAGAEPLESWMATGIDAAVEPAELTLPLSKRIRALLRELSSDAELSSMARVASQLLAVVHVPRNLRSHDELPLGGVSDISNRGSLERLLISELAHDPLTLAVRVAMNEALYLRREAPAQHPPVSRTILVDGGIRMWGVPRVYACAVAMALAASSEDGSVCTLVRTKGNDTVPIDLASASGLREHLASLEPWPDPAEAAIRLLTDAPNRPTGALTELFLITDRSTLDDPSFWQRLDPLTDQQTIYVASVSRDGSFELQLATKLGRRPICAARLDLDQLLANSTTPAPARQFSDRDASLPMILRLEKFPLRLPACLVPKLAAVKPETGLIGITTDRRLMQWTSNRVGGRQLMDTLPWGHIHGVYADADRRVAHVVLTQQVKAIVITVHLDSGDCRTSEYRCDQPLAVALVDRSLLLMRRHSFTVIRPESGDVHESTERSHWLCGRFYRDRNGTGVLAATARGDYVRARSGGVFRAAFDRPGLGPWLLGLHGRVESADGLDSIDFSAAAEAGRVDSIAVNLIASDDGERIILSPSNKLDSGVCVTLATRRVETFGTQDHAHTFLLGAAARWSVGFGVYQKFDAIAVTSDGRLVLRRKKRLLAIRPINDGSLRLRELSHSADAALRAERPFSTPTRLPRTRYHLTAATWPDGSKAWIDSRGMLHVKSSSPRLPEITLALSSDGLAGWTSDGQTFGLRFFIDGEPTTTDSHIDRLLQSFAERLT